MTNSFTNGATIVSLNSSSSGAFNVGSDRQRSAPLAALLECASGVSVFAALAVLVKFGT